MCSVSKERVNGRYYMSLECRVDSIGLYLLPARYFTIPLQLQIKLSYYTSNVLMPTAYCMAYQRTVCIPKARFATVCVEDIELLLP
jgi:hypothetical protein